MKKLILNFGILTCLLATQGCTTHQHHHHYSGNAGIAATPKGIAGTEGKSGAQGDPKPAVSGGIKKTTPSGYAGAEGPSGAMPSAGLPSPSVLARKRELEVGSEPFDEAFWEKAVLNILQWCVLTQCGK